MKALVRGVVRGVLVITAVLLLMLGYGYAQQRLFRWKAERLLADLKTLEVHKSNWADAQRFMKHWGAWGDHQGSCDADHCNYRVYIPLTFSKFGYTAEGFPRGIWLRKVLAHIGIREANAFAGFQIADGHIMSRSFTLYLNQWLDEPSYSAIAASSAEGPRLPDVEAQDKVLHPYRSLRVVMRGYFLVATTPDETPEEKARVLEFKLDCITALHPCMTSGQLLPAAYEEEQAQQPLVQKQMQAGRCYPLWIESRDQENVFVGDVVKSFLQTHYENDPTPMQPLWVLSVKPTRMLKGDLTVLGNEPVHADYEASRLGAKASVQFPFSKVIVLGRLSADRGVDSLLPPIDVDECSVVEANPENLAEAERGAMLDFSHGQY